jgi:hypothetical protein
VLFGLLVDPFDLRDGLVELVDGEPVEVPRRDVD